MTETSVHAVDQSNRTERDANQSRGRLHWLDVLRGLAATSVLLSHTDGFWPASRLAVLDWLFRFNGQLHDFLRGDWGSNKAGNHPGVILFIVLSGFCIHLPQASRSKVQNWPVFLKQYWSRRLIRIWPVFAFGALMGAGVALYGLFHGWADDSQSAPHLWSIIALLMAKLCFLTALWPSDGYLALGNPPLHTVVAEVWLYACYLPLLFLRQAGRWPIALALVFIAFLASFALLGLHFPANWLSESFLRFLLYWVMGAIAAELYLAQRWGPTLKALSLVLVGGAIVLFSLSFIEFRGDYTFKVPIEAAFFAVLIGTIASVERQLGPTLGIRWIKFPVLLGSWVGERSYSLYATHYPLLIVLSAVSASFFWMSTLAIPLAFGVAMITYEAIEKPTHRLARRKSASNNGRTHQ